VEVVGSVIANLKPAAVPFMSTEGSDAGPCSSLAVKHFFDMQLEGRDYSACYPVIARYQHQAR